ncbi:uncharacterized protein TNCV_2807341 [Trichonephila clavipes]|nr:uncharacterized protein TNCV_2807341 [Trichonephila clavipes]
MDSLVLNRLSLSDSRLRYGFSGVYSSDKLPKQRKRYRSFIVNTDPAYFKGRHWQAIYFRQDNHCVFFCSYGTRPQYDIEQFIIENSTSFEWNENILQHPNTMTCGLFCLYFLWHISRGLPINRLRNGNHCANERLVQNFVQSCQVIYSQFGLAIHQNDHQARRRFVEWAQNEIAVVPDFHKRILFSDEAHFWLNGYVNKQNCRIWSEANPQVYVETPLHPEKLTVWCALWAGGILLQKR